MNWLTLETNERKNIALYIMAVASVLFYIDTSIGLYLLREKLEYVFWLAIVAHAQLFMILAGFVAQLVKRRISLSKQGITIDDQGGKQNDIQIEQPVDSAP